MKKQKFLDKFTDLVEETLVKEGVSDYFTIDDLLEDEDRVAIKLTYDYSDAEYIKEVLDLYERKCAEDVKIKDLYKTSGIKDEVKAFVTEQQRLRSEALALEGDDYEDEYDYDEEDDYDDDLDDDLEDDSDFEEDGLLEKSEEEPASEFAHAPSYIHQPNHAPEEPRICGARISEINHAGDHNLNFGGLSITFTDREGRDTYPEDTLEESLSQANLKGVCVPMENILSHFGLPANECPKLHILTTEDGNNGPVIIADKGFMDTACKEIGSQKLLCLPSSVHEWLVTSANSETLGRVDDFEDMVREVNATLYPGEVLANAVFVYDNDAKELTEAHRYLETEKTSESKDITID